MADVGPENDEEDGVGGGNVGPSAGRHFWCL